MVKSFKPDVVCHLPNFRERKGKIKYIIIHCSRSNPEKQIDNLNYLKLSAHYIIGQDGCAFETLEPDNVAYHAGVSRWKQSKKGGSLNEVSIGIELEAPDMGQRSQSYSLKQINKLILLLKYLMAKYGVKAQNIIGHSDIAPTRKPDPGRGFPWKKLAKAGLGISYEGKKNAQVCKPERYYLQRIGYDTVPIDAARYAFCRHFFTSEVAVEENLQYLLDNVYPKDFKPKHFKRYLRRLAEVAEGQAKR